MKYPLHRHFLAIIGTLAVLVVLLPIILIIFSLTYIASIPSRVGSRAPVEKWIQRGMEMGFDFELMRQFRNDIFYVILPYIETTDEFDRWWVLREMELSTERHASALRSGEYAIILLLTFGSVVWVSAFDLPVGAILAILALVLSSLIIIRTILIKILVFKPEVHMEEPTHDLTVRMAFNRGPMSQASPIAIALLTLFIGLSRGVGYDLGLNLIERIASLSHSGDDDKWKADD